VRKTEIVEEKNKEEIEERKVLDRKM